MGVLAGSGGIGHGMGEAVVRGGVVVIGHGMGEVAGVAGWGCWRGVEVLVMDGGVAVRGGVVVTGWGCWRGVEVLVMGWGRWR